MTNTGWVVINVSYRVYINPDPKAIEKAMAIYNGWLEAEYGYDPAETTKLTDFISPTGFDFVSLAEWAEMVMHEFEDSGEIDRTSAFVDHIHVDPPTRTWVAPTVGSTK